MKKDWKYQDIIDVEFFFRQDSEKSSSELHSRDRQIYLEHVDSQLQDEKANPSSLLQSWLLARKEKHPDKDQLPGTIAQESHTLLRLLLIFFGIISGGSAGLVFFSYAGATPVNVLHFLVLFVCTQLLLALFLLMRGVLLRLGLKSLPQSLSVRFMTVLTSKLSNFLQRQGNSRLTAEQRLSLQATLGKLKATNTTYGTLLYWPLFLLIQLLTISFNAGLLGSTFLKVSVSDIAFGWQSTLQFSGQSLHAFVSWMALPWSWLFGEGIAYPTLSEIEGSRIILKEGIAHLQTPDLVSWWPFLLLCIAFYGLFLRVLLYGYGSYRQSRAASALRFDTPIARQVVRRMQTPVVSTQAQPEPVAKEYVVKEEAPEEFPSAVQEEYTNPILLLLPDEICDQCDRNSLATLLNREGFSISATRRFMVDYESDQKLLENVAEEDVSHSAGIVILMEAWMPPLVSFQSFLKELRQKIGTSLPIMLRLVGKPAGGVPLTPVQDETLYTIWKQKIESLGDPYLEIDVLIEKETA